MDGGIGHEVRRKEDARLVAGRGQYADDIPLEGVAYAAMVRSAHAHARIVSIDASTARAMPGVLAVLTGEDARADGLSALPHATGNSRVGSDVPLRNRDGSERLTTPQLPLPTKLVRFVGEAVAIVVAETIATAKDAAEAVEIEWDPLPAVVNSIDAVRDDAPLLWDHVPHNVALEAEIGDAAATEALFAQAAHRVSLSTWVQRVTGVHMEPRTSAAVWDEETRRYTIYASGGTGVVQMRSDLSKVLGVPEDAVRLVAPQDVGGNFGTRNALYPEFALLPWASRRIGRPVKHLAERQEAFLSDFQGRDLHVDAELALARDGRFLAFRSTNTSNIGAYTTSFVPLNKGAQLMTSLYRFEAAHVVTRAVVTNTPATIPYRSAGRPEAMFVIERLIDIAARECGFDRMELRRRNMIPEEAQPYRNPFGITYDNGDYAGAMQLALDRADWNGFEARRAEARGRGKRRGFGFANYIEGTSGLPRERADITVQPDGIVEVIVGTQNTGQGHETSFSQIVSDWLGVPFDAVRICAGDTDVVKAGGGSHSGRSMRFGSIVLRSAADEIIEKGKNMAAALLECAVADIRFEKGRFTVAGTDRSLGLLELASAARDARELSGDLRIPLTGASEQIISGLAFPYGAAVCELEVDPETGAVEIARYTSVDDVGRAINPMIVDGQTHGGIAQGVGQALLEWCFYDTDSGQNLAGSFMDYAILRAGDLPSFTTELSEVPAKSHPLGIRPGGEGGTTPALATTINAIVDALSEFGVRHIEMPATPARIWQAIQTAPGAKVGANTRGGDDDK